MSFASGTTVPVVKSRLEIEALLVKHKATTAAAGFDEQRAIVAFTMQGRRIQFTIPLPRRDEPQFVFVKGSNWNKLTQAKGDDLFQAACRQKWRALLLALKAKFVALEENLETFDQVFLAHVLLDDGQTVYEAMTRVSANGGAPLLPAARQLPAKGGT